jgi:GNAT superfamily N-acetyltransferase
MHRLTRSFPHAKTGMGGADYRWRSWDHDIHRQCTSQSPWEFVISSIASRLGAEFRLPVPNQPCQEKPDMKRIRIREASWPADRMALETVRCEVFVKGQNVPRSLEFDGLDSSALHWLAFTPGEEPVGTLRLLPSGQVGRAAVLRADRGQGVGSRLLRHAIAAAEAHG